MSLHEKARTDVEVDGRDASQVLDDLKKRADDYRKAMVEANKANDLVNFKNAEKGLKDTEKSMRQLEKATFDVNNVMRNLSATSQSDLLRAKRQLTAELRNTTRGTQEYINKSKQLRLVTGELRKVRTEMTGVSGSQRGMLRGMTRMTGMFLGTTASVTAVTMAMRKYAQEAMEYESRLADLSAITGLAGENLDWLSQEARRLSTSMTEDGVRITKSAGDILEAYKLMGSAKPELLGNKEALSMVTTEALKLAEAAKMDAATAVTALADVMNQFGADASQASRYINALAAGSKAGAAAVDDIAKSVVGFGAVAGTANISVEQSIGLVETLAEKGIKGAEAGTMLRNVLLRLQTGAEHLNPSIVGLETALENLSKENYSSTEMLELFGQRGITVGTILANSTDRVKHFTEAVTDTNVAIEQANINTGTSAAKLEQYRNDLKNTGMELGQNFIPAMGSTVRLTTALLRVVSAIISFIRDYGRHLGILTAAILAYNIAIRISAILTTGWTGVVKIATAATKVFNTVLKANPIGLLIGVLTAATSAFFLFRKRTDEATSAQKELNEVIRESKDLFEDFVTIEERMNVAGALNLRQLQNLRESIKSQISAQEDMTASLIQEMEARVAADERMIELQKEFDAEKNEQLQVQIAYQLMWRRTAIREEFQLERHKHNQSLETLREHLERVNDIITDHPEQAQDIQDQFYEKEIEALEQHLKEKELALLENYNNQEISKEQLENELSALELSGLMTRLALHEQFGRETIDLKIEIAKKEGQLVKDIQKQNTEDYYKEDLEQLEQHIKERRLLLLQEHNDGIISAEQLKERLETLDLTHLQARKDLQDQYGKDTMDINLAIAEHKRKTLADEVAATKAAIDIENQIREQALDKRRQEAEEHKQIMDTLAGSLGDLMGKVATDAEMTSQEVARNLVMMFLDAVHSTVRLAIGKIWAQSLASAESVATFGAAGVAKATALSAMVELAFAGVKAAVSNTMSTDRVKQRFTGRYDVTGADDGRNYSARYLPSPGTGFIWNPALISERGPEIYIDAKRSRNIRMRYPQLLEAIKAVPQYASGNVPAQPVPGSGAGLADQELKKLIIHNNAVMNDLRSQLARGIDSRISYGHMKSQVDKAERIERASSRG